MDITVTIPTLLRPLTENQKEVKTRGKTVAELIDNLDQRFPGIKNRLMENGTVHNFINIYVNDNDIRFNKNLNTALNAGDNIIILPAVAGGAR